MDKELLVKLAEQAGLPTDGGRILDDSYRDITEQVCHLASLVAEECAKVCEQLPPPYARDIERSDFAEAIREKFTAA